jgi:hypothetical protein
MLFFSTGLFLFLRNDENISVENVFLQLQLEELDINISMLSTHLSF